MTFDEILAQVLDLLQIMTQNRLGLVYHAAGDCREAMHLTRRAVASLEGEPVPPRLGQLAPLP